MDFFLRIGPDNCHFWSLFFLLKKKEHNLELEQETPSFIENGSDQGRPNIPRFQYKQQVGRTATI